jgi:hypothetical protein
MGTFQDASIILKADTKEKMLPCREGIKYLDMRRGLF